MRQKFVVGTAAVVAICSALLTPTNDASAMSAGMRSSPASTSFGGRPQGGVFNPGRGFGGEGFQNPRSGKIPLGSAGLVPRLNGPEIGLLNQPPREGTCDKPAKRPAGTSAYCIKEVACRVGRHPDGRFIWEYKCATWKALH